MAFVAFVRHRIQEGKVREAADRINGNGDRMAQRTGFVSRELLQRRDDDHELATVTVWESAEAYDAWVEHNRSSNVHAGKASPYIGSPETHLYLSYEPAAADDR